MKKFILVVSILVVIYFAFDALYYRYGFYIDLDPSEKVTTFTKTDGDKILIKKSSKYKPLEIKGVNLDASIPGQWSTDFDIDESTYKRWFKQISEMGANTIRVYTVQSDTFYDALYEYNENSKKPLFILQGSLVNDYIQNSRRDAYDKDFRETWIDDCKTMVDVIHGERKLIYGQVKSSGHGTYNNDVSKWVIGYILGVDWNESTVEYTNRQYEGESEYTHFRGEYMYTSKDASPFENLLAMVGDKVIEYESNRYKQQRLVAFSNWTSTDPFEYPEEVEDYYKKFAKVDTEKIKTTKEYKSGCFASYHVYPYYQNYLSRMKDWSAYGINKENYRVKKGKYNTYKAYLAMLKKHHKMPVVISEFGVTSARGMTMEDDNMNRNQGHMSEKRQGEIFVECYKDIKDVGCAGGCVFAWQDSWEKKIWNVMYTQNTKRDPYWLDYQTASQNAGLLSFDPGEKKSVCYVDGDISEWKKNKPVYKDNDYSLSMKYDEKNIYLLIHKKNLKFGSDKLYIPIDITQKSGSSYYRDDKKSILFDRASDFVIEICGKENTRMKVQERYESLRANFSKDVYDYDTYLEDHIPSRNSSKFVNIDMITRNKVIFKDGTSEPADVFETGKLKYGNANPKSKNYNSLADFICNGDYIEMKLPWGLLNFSDPSKMNIHDDYYENHGVEYIHIDKMYMGIGNDRMKRRIEMVPFKLEGWNDNETYHERLKSSYYILKSYWRK